MKGRVAVLRGYGEGYDLEEHPVPEPEPGAMVVKVALAGICGSDLHAWRGELSQSSSPSFNSPQSPGLAQGHEMTGSVYRLGKGVTTDALGRPLQEGDRVCYSIHFPCFRCPICVQGGVQHLPQSTRRPARRHLAPLHRHLRRLLLPAPQPLCLQGAAGTVE